MIRDSRAYYLIAYESPHPEDGKFHKVTVRVKRSRATVVARSGYWAFKRGENSAMAPAALVAVPPAVRSTAPGPVTVSGRLLDRRGQPLTDLRLTPDTATPELRLALGSLGPGEYVIELAQ